MPPSAESSIAVIKPTSTLTSSASTSRSTFSSTSANRKRGRKPDKSEICHLVPLSSMSDLPLNPNKSQNSDHQNQTKELRNFSLPQNLSTKPTDGSVIVKSPNRIRIDDLSLTMISSKSASSNLDFPTPSKQIRLDDLSVTMIPPSPGATLTKNNFSNFEKNSVSISVKPIQDQAVHKNGKSNFVLPQLKEVTITPAPPKSSFRLSKSPSPDIVEIPAEKSTKNDQPINLSLSSSVKLGMSLDVCY